MYVRTYQEMSCYCTYKSDALCLLHSTVDHPCLLNVHSCIRMYVRMCTCQDCMYVLTHVCIMLAWVLCIHMCKKPYTQIRTTSDDAMLRSSATTLGTGKLKTLQSLLTKCRVLNSSYKGTAGRMAQRCGHTYCTCVMVCALMYIHTCVYSPCGDFVLQRCVGFVLGGEV